MIKEFEIIVVGGGIVGISSAISMARRGFKVALIDAKNLHETKNNTPSRVYALNKSSQILLDKINVWQKINKEQIAYYQHMYVWDKLSKSHIEFSAKMIGESSLGAIIEEDSLKSCLLQATQELELELISNQKVIALDVLSDSVILTSKDENTQYKYKANLLIAADGPLSNIRNLLQVELVSWAYHQSAFIANVETQKPHANTAYQVFTEDGTLAFLPLANKYQSSIVWSVSSDKYKSLNILNDSAFIDELNVASEFKLGTITSITERKAFPLYMRHAKTYADKNWLLMGDAAHSIHPLAGLGLNVGLNDLDNFLKIIDEKKVKPWNRSLLGAYQRQRKYEVWGIIALMEGLKTLFINPLPPVVWLRGVGLTTCNKIKFLKQFFINQANK